MSDFRNGMAAKDIDGAVWVKSVASNAKGQCVEASALPSGEVALRNSRDPEGPALVFTPGEIKAFFAGVRGSEFDHLIGA
ncbi:DUF397 domain-containing protein [Kitasatospora griseola]|uniref:DUF397 domain-containing protein n=1 Tax=Kitasatospora griseola TaxID=2064 RepID=UPI003855C69B